MSLESILRMENHNRLTELFNENKNNLLPDWLTFQNTFKPGKQGLVGMLLNEQTDLLYVFKISQYINFLVEHEYTIMNSLNELSPYCPHFCKSVGYMECVLDANITKEGDPFVVNSNYPIKNSVMLTELVENSCKFYNYIKSDKISENILYSVVKQVLLAIDIAQTQKKFTHYDLHSFNIMMKTCDKDVVFVYAFDEENQFAVPTFGHYPVIIDFGFSYISDMEGKPLWASMAHTNVGFMSDRYDSVADPKLFLVTVSDEINLKRKSKKSKKFRRIVKNIFHPLNIEWDSGWDCVNDSGAADYILELLEPHNTRSNLFKENAHHCIDIIQTLIILPLEKQEYSDIETSYKAFLKEWIKIENNISSHYFNIYILKHVVNAARNVRDAYLNEHTRKKAVSEFKTSIYDKINTITKFCNPKLNCEKLLCSILCLSICAEGVMYDYMKMRTTEKQIEYEEMPLQTTKEIYAVIESNLPSKYTYSENTKIVLFDCKNKTTTEHKLSSVQAYTINKIHPLCIGTSIYDILKNKM
jgi:hypothetical protein